MNAVFTALKTFILSLIDTEVVQGLGNSVSMPPGAFISMTATMQTRLSTNHVTTSATERTVTQPTRWDIQVDCYGPDAADWANIICTMMRDEYACQYMDSLYADDPRAMPLINGEENYEKRFTVNAVIQSGVSVTVPQESAIALDIGLVDVVATYN